MPDRESFIRAQLDRDGRKESTTVNNTLYDVVSLEDYLLHNPEAVQHVVMPLDDPRLLDAVAEGQHYWHTRSDEHIGPYEIISRWEEYLGQNPGASVDEFLDHLAETQPDWSVHVSSLKHAATRLDKPLWMMGGSAQPQYPFDGMHRLTRAYMENQPAIPVDIWTELPEQSILKID